MPDITTPVLRGGFIEAFAESVTAAQALVRAAQEQLRARVAPSGAIDAAALDDFQAEAHGFAWMAAYAAVLEATLNWCRALDVQGRFGTLEQNLVAIGAAGYLNQLCHGIAMSQDEIVYPALLGLHEQAARTLTNPGVAEVLRRGGQQARISLLALLDQQGLQSLIDRADPDEQLAMVRGNLRAFTDERIAPFAAGWHNEDRLIPLETVQDLAKLGVFGLTTPERFGGSGMGAATMCVVTEELSRGYIGAGSLGTRAEIACELIRSAGTPEQQARYLPRIASGEILTTAVFTEPNTGSDLAHLSVRAERHGDVYRIFGAKTWITHAARADLMLLLARTDPARSDHNGLTMFLAEKPRGTDADLFPAPGMSGSEIGVLGYRGMREYEIAFDGFVVPTTHVLGAMEGDGFRQLMATFELARLQTAARGLGVGQNALELAYAYATTRIQFGKPIIKFPRIGNKIAWMAAELTLIRQFVQAVALRKETGLRCDVEAGMAKLLSARAAWSAADNAVQVHGGNGYALEYPISRVLCDARILNIFEGTAEIQAGIIARGLLQR
jgi:(2S)-methylsuccinyl-CoA dehydrogenase